MLGISRTVTGATLVVGERAASSTEASRKPLAGHVLVAFGFGTSRVAERPGAVGRDRRAFPRPASRPRSPSVVVEVGRGRRPAPPAGSAASLPVTRICSSAASAPTSRLPTRSPARRRRSPPPAVRRASSAFPVLSGITDSSSTTTRTGVRRRRPCRFERVGVVAGAAVAVRGRGDPGAGHAVPSGCGEPVELLRRRCSSEPFVEVGSRRGSRRRAGLRPRRRGDARRRPPLRRMRRRSDVASSTVRDTPPPV